MERRKFTREFKLEAVKLIKERGVGYAQASKDLAYNRRCCAIGSRILRAIRSRLFPAMGR
jgi:transposase